MKKDRQEVGGRERKRRNGISIDAKTKTHTQASNSLQRLYVDSMVQKIMLKPTDKQSQWLYLLLKMLCCAKSLQSPLTLCDPMDHSPPGSFVHGILHARILEQVAMPSSRGSSQPRDRTHSSYISSIQEPKIHFSCQYSTIFYHKLEEQGQYYVYLPKCKNSPLGSW